MHLYHYAGNNPVKYTDPDGRVPRTSIIVFDGEVFVSGDNTDPVSIKDSRLLINDVSDTNLLLTLYPNSRIQMRIDGIEKTIEMKNKTNQYINIDVNHAINVLGSILGPAEIDAYKTWEDYGELGLASMKNLLQSGLIGSLSVLNAAMASSGNYVPLDSLAQPIGETLASSKDDIINFANSLKEVIGARLFLKQTYSIEFE
jgi:hypothetical protein